ncbi:MAG: type II toxin-antitoxin system HicB family antitoxin [Deltaproteobacteria bacterium]|nr:type II toxin-antitoxin system HicB family antitoxin [Deltaproteobacteria bacterium]
MKRLTRRNTLSLIRELKRTSKRRAAKNFLKGYLTTQGFYTYYRRACDKKLGSVIAESENTLLAHDDKGHPVLKRPDNRSIVPGPRPTKPVLQEPPEPDLTPPGAEDYDAFATGRGQPCKAPKPRGRMKVIKATFTVTLPIQIHKEGGVYVSSCPLLDVWSQGETLKHAEENLVEAIQLFINSCFVRGTLDKVLRECGFVPLATMPKAQAKSIQGRQVKVPVPIPYALHGQQAGCQS